MSYGTSTPGRSTPAAAAGYDKPLPEITELTQGFWDHTRAGRLAVQACTHCGDVHFPASPVCPKCLSEAQEWRPVCGRGRLESWVEYHRAYWPGFAGELPYRVCLVRLEEGPLMVSNLVGEAAEIGDEVRVVFEKVTDAVTLPKFARGASG
jgi:uncharacterized OB-fold protein